MYSYAKEHFAPLKCGTLFVTNNFELHDHDQQSTIKEET